MALTSIVFEQVRDGSQNGINPNPQMCWKIHPNALGIITDAPAGLEYIPIPQYDIWLTGNHIKL